MFEGLLNLVRRRRPDDAPFVVRSGARDTQSDTKRFDVVRASVAQAIMEFEREHQGLISRRERARDAMAASLGNTDGIYEPREPETEDMLRQAEAQFASAESRLADIKRHLDVLHGIRATLDSGSAERADALS